MALVHARAEYCATGPTTVRKAVMRERFAMLMRIETYSTQQIAPALETLSDNSSHYAATLRRASRLFGLSVGNRWRYPAFQFDPQRHVYPQMRSVLIRLDVMDAWQQLIWFLTPQSSLEGRSPLDAWLRDREAVVRCAGSCRSLPRSKK